MTVLQLSSSGIIKSMGELTDGLNGPIRGKVGKLVYYTLRGKTIVRTVPKKRGKKRTLKGKTNTTGFARLQKWMKPIGGFVKYGFKDYGTSDVGYRSAISYALNNEVIQGTYPNQFVDPSRIRVTGGELPVPASASAVLEEGYVIRFNWDPGDLSEMRKDDQAMLLVYAPANPEHIGRVKSKLTGAFRKEGTDTLSVSAERSDQEFYVYLGFVNDQRTQQSHSQYLGSIFIPGLEQEELFVVRLANQKKAIEETKKEPKLTAEERALSIARNLRNMGLADEDIATATGLSLEAIEEMGAG